MARVIGKGACDPCCTDWKQKIRELWENYQEVIKGIKAGSDTVYPDGNGIADIDGAIENEVTRQISDESLVTSDDLQTAIADMATIQDLDSGLSTLQSTKQDKLVNQVNIKSVNGQSLLGSGDLQVSVESIAWDDVTNKPEFAEVATSGSYDDLSDKPTIPAAQVNADWNATEGVAEILNKPTIPAAQVNADWDAASGVAQILNKPTIPSGTDLVPSTSGVTDGYVLTNDNGTPAWKAGGGGGGSGATWHTYTKWGDLATAIHDHGGYLIDTAHPHVAYSIGTTNVTIYVMNITGSAFYQGFTNINLTDTGSTGKAFTGYGKTFNTTDQTFSDYQTSLNIALTRIKLLY